MFPFWSRRARPARGRSTTGRPAMALAALAVLAALALPGTGRAQDNFLGEIRLVPYSFAPAGWALCNGQLLSISTNTALFSLLGTTYGGDGKSTFALPDMRGRVTLEAGQGPGLSDYFLGEVGGEEFHTLTVGEMAPHTHAALADPGAGSSDRPAGLLPAVNAGAMPEYGTTPSVAMSPSAIGVAGGGLPHENRPPFLVMHYIIAMQGIYPARSKPGAGQPTALAPALPPGVSK